MEADVAERSLQAKVDSKECGNRAECFQCKAPGGYGQREELSLMVRKKTEASLCKVQAKASVSVEDAAVGLGDLAGGSPLAGPIE